MLDPTSRPAPPISLWSSSATNDRTVFMGSWIKRVVIAVAVVGIASCFAVVPANAGQFPAPVVDPTPVAPGGAFTVSGVADCIEDTTLVVTVADLQLSATVSGADDWQVQMTVPLGTALGDLSGDDRGFRVQLSRCRPGRCTARFDLAGQDRWDRARRMCDHVHHFRARRYDRVLLLHGHEQHLGHAGEPQPDRRQARGCCSPTRTTSWPRGRA